MLATAQTVRPWTPAGSRPGGLSLGLTSPGERSLLQTTRILMGCWEAQVSAPGNGAHLRHPAPRTVRTSK